MARPTGDPSVVSSFKPTGPASRKQLHLKQRSEEDVDFNDAEYVNDTFDIFYIGVWDTNEGRGIRHNSRLEDAVLFLESSRI